MMKGRGNMLAMSDIYIDQFFPVFANAGFLEMGLHYQLVQILNLDQAFIHCQG